MSKLFFLKAHSGRAITTQKQRTPTPRAMLHIFISSVHLAWVLAALVVQQCTLVRCGMQASEIYFAYYPRLRFKLFPQSAAAAAHMGVFFHKYAAESRRCVLIGERL